MPQDIALLLSMKSLLVFLLVLARVSGALVTAPLFSTFPIPVQLKAALSALVAFIIYPFVLQHTQAQLPTEMMLMAAYMIKEVLIGILIGFCASLIFTGIQIGGQLMSTQMGLTIAEALDPITHQNVPIIGQFYLFIATLTFIYLNGHQWIFSSIYSSYKSMPIGLDIVMNGHLTEKLIYFISQLFPIAFSVIMPIFAVLFIVDLALGFISKMMPQMNVFMVSLPVKIYIGIACMVIFMKTTTVYMSGMMSTLLDNLRSLFM